MRLLRFGGPTLTRGNLSPMATTTHISLSEYLGTAYSPDREYVDGEVRERNVGKWEHARVQALLAGCFVNNEMARGSASSTEQCRLRRIVFECPIWSCSTPDRSPKS